MVNKLVVGERVEVVKDDTDEFSGCVGEVACFDYDDRRGAPIGVAFGKADNTIPLVDNKWGAWFEKSQLRKTRLALSPVCPVPPNNRLGKPMLLSSLQGSP